MSRHLAVACLIYAVLVIQPGVASDLAVGSLRPWMPGIAIVACVLVFDGPASLVWAGILGLGVDCQSVERPGIHLIIATLTASGLVSIRPDNRRSGAISVGLYVFVAALVWRMAASIVHALLDRHRFDIADLALSACWDGFSSASVAIAALVAFQLVMNTIRPQYRSSMSLSNRWSMLTEK